MTMGIRGIALNLALRRSVAARGSSYLVGVAPSPEIQDHLDGV